MKEIFCESNGQLSTSRIMCFAALIVAIVTTFTTKDFGMASMWVAAAFGGKIGSKIFEEKNVG